MDGQGNNDIGKAGANLETGGDNAPVLARPKLENLSKGRVSDPSVLNNLVQEFIDDPMTSEEMTPFLPHSSQSVYGVDNQGQFMEHMLQSNFHARVIKKMSPDAVFLPTLDSYLQGYSTKRVIQGMDL